LSGRIFELAHAFARGRRRLAHEAGDQLGQGAGLVLGREGVGVLDPLQPRVGQARGQLLGMPGREEPVFAGPGDQGRVAERVQPRGRLAGVPGVEGHEGATKVGAHRGVGEGRVQVAVLGVAVDGALGEPPEGGGQAPERARTQRGQQRLGVQPEWTRIPLIDAPSVLGWLEWREVDQRYGLGLVTAGLDLGMETGALRRQPVTPLAHVLLAGMGEAALMIASAKEPKAVRAEVEATLVGLIEGLRT